MLCVSGVSEYVGTEICTSRQKRFSLVTFVDTPGLVDGDMKYPFDVDQAILWLGGICFVCVMSETLVFYRNSCGDKANSLKGCETCALGPGYDYFHFALRL